MTPPRLEIDGAGWIIGIPHHVTQNHGSGMRVPQDVDGVIMHTMVGNLPDADAEFMNGANQVSAHLGIAQNGDAIQWVDLLGGNVAWAEMAGNNRYYSIEHADNGNPNIPLTTFQINRSAQFVELLSRIGHFPLVEANSVGQEGYGTHYMGGAAWGGHSCPDIGGNHVRSGQRPAILALAAKIRAGDQASAKPVMPPGQWLDASAWTWVSASISGHGLNSHLYTYPYNTANHTWPVSGGPVPPGQWLNPDTWTWADVSVSGKGLNGHWYTFTYDKVANKWNEAK